MTWSVIIPIILFSLFKIVITCLPSGPVEWILIKFELHSTLDKESLKVFYSGKEKEGSEKPRIVHSFNEATFLEKYYIWPGTEDLYFNPESNKTPFIIQTHRGKTDDKLWLFCYNDRVDVAYSLRSDSLQEQMSAS